MTAFSLSRYLYGAPYLMNCDRRALNTCGTAWNQNMADERTNLLALFFPFTFTITLHSDCCSSLNFSLRRIPHKPFPWLWRAAYDSLADMVSLWTKGILWYFYKMNGDVEAFWKMFRVARETVLVQRNPRDCSIKSHTDFLAILLVLCMWSLFQITDLANVGLPTISLCFL